ncbi:MAG: shikimate dehydrogenase [Candidatus Azobacteroides sp.]|nr:shikimate dehydrogenase [Candidatus Azobacteroides sp.]
MDKYGLIGYPLHHSFSQSYFNEKFRAENINAEYVNFEIPTIKEFPDIIKSNPNLKGLNVTIPYKEQVIQYLDDLSDNAKAIGAVNVIKFIRNKSGKKIKLIGYNSDVIGFQQSLEPLLKKQHQSALILGNGGASKAIKRGLDNLGLSSQFVSRERTANVIRYEDITPEIMEKHTVIINCTPVGMFPNVNECPNIPYELITSNHLLYDLLYNPDETLFLKKGKEHGAKVKNGLEMLLLQAFASWEFWH